jgi:hypothetical protein
MATHASPKTVGERSEAMVLAAILKEGLPVLIPFGDNQRYDLVVETAQGFVRVQVKTGAYHRGAVCFWSCSSEAHRGGSRRGYQGEAEMFGVYCPHLDRVYFIPVAAVPERQVVLRVEPARNGQAMNVRRAEEYEHWPAVIPR